MRRYFEYITLRTPILSVLLAVITFFIVFSIAGNIMVNQYYKAEVKLQDFDVVYIELEKDFEYDKDIEYVYLNFDDRSERIKCVFLYEEIRNESTLLYFKPEEPILKDDNSSMYIDIIYKKVSLARRILGDYTN